MRVVVTGATGNVGTSVLQALARDPAVEEIVGLARRRPQLSLPRTTWVTADVARDDLAPHFAGADAVVHLAWLIQPSRDRATTRAVNVEGSRRVFAATAAAGVPSLVYASSVGAYSPGPKDRRVDESWPTGGVPNSFYSRDKADVERILDGFEAAYPDLSDGQRPPSQYRGPGPRLAARSPGLASLQRSSDRQPQPMHSVRLPLRRSSSAMRASILAVHVLESRAQSRRVGARSGGSLASSAPISSSVSPTRWAKTMKAMRRSTGRL